MFQHTKPRYPVAELCELLHKSKPKLHEDINTGKLRTHMDGRRRYASAQAVDDFIADLERKSGVVRS